MSFSTKVKEELAKRNDIPRHCRIAEIAAIAAFCGGVEDGRLFFKSENEYVISAVRELIARTFKVSGEGDRDTMTGSVRLISLEIRHLETRALRYLITCLLPLLSFRMI